jgi:RHS repeat-associated protein
MTVGTSASSLADYSYTLGPAGNRTAVTELSGRTVNYTYDDLYRLTSESIANDPHGVNGSVSYSYDPVGNRLSRLSFVAPVPSQSSSYDANDRLTSDNYDNNGNTTAANSNSYAYDFENHLTGLNSGNVTYVYDGDGNRVSKTVGGVTTNYLVDANNPTGYSQVVEELQAGSVVKSFTYGHDLISQQIVGGSLSFYGHDGHGSVRTLTDPSGAITDSYDYDAFGNLIYRSGTTPNDYLYSGEQFDASLGFYYLRARYMNPASGRFWTMDSFEGRTSDPPSLHKYSHAHGNPTNQVDPSGNFSLSEAVQTVQSYAISAAVFLGYNQALHRVVDRVGSALNIASFLGGGDEYRYEYVSVAGGPSAAAQFLASSGETMYKVLQSLSKIGTATGATALTSSSGIARSIQSTSGYRADPWRDISLHPGKLLYAGEPNVSGFFTTELTITRAGGDATKLFEGLQARPYYGQYRNGVTAFELMEECPAAFGIVRENPQYGPGGFPQVYVPNWEQKLRPVVSYPLDNRTARIP